jgi:uncharacterized protein (UPF0332 family)
MSFDWTQYISLAEDLIKDDPDEARVRSAISRAYYGAFICCRIYKELNNSRRNDIHRQVIESYKLSEIREELSIGHLLDNLRINRGAADYNGFFEPQKEQTIRDIESAKRIIEKLNELD